MMKTNMFAASAVLIMLAACGGGGAGNVDMVPTSPPQTGAPTPSAPAPSAPGQPTSPSQPDAQPVKPAPTADALQARLSDAATARKTVSALSSTPVANVPVSGSATFSGPALLKVSRGSASYFIVGDSRLNLNFGSRQMSGGITNMQGRRGNGTTFSAPGRITYDTGAIRTGQNVFTLGYDGSLSAGNDRIALDGTAVGGILGPNGSAIQALDGTPGTDIVKGSIPNMTVQLNGQPAAGELLIIGQK